jgi:hypothetical protein
MNELGIRTLVQNPESVPDRLKIIEQDIQALLKLGAVLVTVQVVKHAQDHQR